jgi:hypothetical protein
VAWWGVEDMAAKTPGRRSGSSPEAAKRCASGRRALRATTVLVRMDVGVPGVWVDLGWIVGSPFTSRLDRGKLSTCERHPRRTYSIVAPLSSGSLKNKHKSLVSLRYSATLDILLRGFAAQRHLSVVVRDFTGDGIPHWFAPFRICEGGADVAVSIPSSFKE